MNKIAYLSLLTCLPLLSLSGCNNNETKEKVMHDIILKRNDHCSISTSKTHAYEGEEITISIDSIENNYSLDRFVVNDVEIEGDTFLMPNKDAFIDVHLEKVDVYSLTIEASKYALIYTDKAEYAEGETVDIDYECKGNYILSSFFVNEEPINGTSFKMPKENVTLRGEFKYVFDDTEWQVSSTADLLSKSFWYIKYGQEGIEMKIMVDDPIVCGFDIAEGEMYRDNIEFTITKSISEEGVIPAYAYRILIPAIGNAIIKKGNGSGWKQDYPSSALLSYSSLLKYLDNKDGYNGYEIRVFISYELLQVSREEALSNISLGISIRNATHYGSTVWKGFTDYGVDWENLTTHPIIGEDGSMIKRNG